MLLQSGILRIFSPQSFDEGTFKAKRIIPFQKMSEKTAWASHFLKNWKAMDFSAASEQVNLREDSGDRTWINNALGLYLLFSIWNAFYNLIFDSFFLRSPFWVLLMKLKSSLVHLDLGVVIKSFNRSFISLSCSKLSELMRSSFFFFYL